MKKKSISRPVTVVSAAAAAYIISKLLPAVKVRGSSMSPTLEDNDIVLCIRKGKLRRGDIVAAKLCGRLVIKRVLAFGGDTVIIDRSGTVSVNGTTLNEPYVDSDNAGVCDIAFTCSVPEGKMFVAGDNRAASTDSRDSSVGCAACGSTAGRAVFRLYPLNRAGFIRRGGVQRR